MIKPFPYQKLCLFRLSKARRWGKRRALVVMATGLGKTVTVALDVSRVISKLPKGRVLYLCHQNDILRQARTTFEAIIDGDSSNYGYYHGRKKESGSKFLFGSFQTMRKHLRQFRRDEFDYIIVDESHHTHAGTYLPIVKYFSPKFLLGVTATPDRADLQDIREVFGKEVFSLELPEALARKLLTGVDYLLVTDELIDLGKIENPYRLTVKELNKKIFVPKRDKEIVRIINEKTRHLKNPRMMIFCSSIRHAERFHAQMPDSLPIHSGLARGEQQVRLEAFRQGLVSRAITVDKFNEGIDIPEVEVVVFLRSTQSNTIFYQQLGRGLRKIKGKKEVLVLDFVANCDRIQMIYEFKKDIERAKKKIKRKKGITGGKDIHFKGFNFVFTEKAKDILEVLKKLNKKKEGYTRKDLIKNLQKAAKQLGHSPTMEEIGEVSSWSRAVYVSEFGSFNEALQEAGLSPNQYIKNKDELLRKLKILTQKLGKPPTQREVNEASKRRECPSVSGYNRVFGSLANAIEAIGLNPSQKRGWTRLEIIEELKALSAKLGFTPTKENIEREHKLTGKLPSGTTIRKIFGSLGAAKRAAGLKID